MRLGAAAVLVWSGVTAGCAWQAWEVGQWVAAGWLGENALILWWLGCVMARRGRG